jgi:hypothetical protein
MTKNKKTMILFVYNADNGLANSLIDYGKKYVSPSKYDCQLCMVSYGPFGMKKNWKAFVSSLSYPVKFLHKNEFIQKYPQSSIKLPAMLISNDEEIETLINSIDFDKILSLDELKTKVSYVLENYKYKR